MSWTAKPGNLNPLSDFDLQDQYTAASEALLDVKDPNKKRPPFSGPYTLILRNETFQLSQSQIQFDSPNFFTFAFEGQTAGDHAVLHDRRPDVFKVILDYLSGYDILPVEIEGLSREKALKYLTQDADFFMLDKLKTLLLAKRGPGPLPAIPPWYFDATKEYEYFEEEVSDFRDAWKSGQVKGRSLMATQAQSRGPFPLFLFSDIQLEFFPGAVPGSWDSRFLFQRSEEALANRHINRLPGHRNASFSFADQTFPREAIYETMNSSTVKPTRFVEAYQVMKNCFLRGNCLTFHVRRAVGFFKENQLFLCYLELEGMMEQWKGVSNGVI